MSKGVAGVEFFVGAFALYPRAGKKGKLFFVHSTTDSSSHLFILCARGKTHNALFKVEILLNNILDMSQFISLCVYL
jgi:hypothetical protein